ncbi:hypothetical protein BGZ98_009934 [Dissophora globulifera]|nr:hypothetical protein BGZ98_009934 [Dissophora globulifera]
MDNIGNSAQPRQRFQEHSSPDSLPVASASYITAVFDQLSGQYVILWSDITVVFSNARYVSHNGTLVPFMKDDDKKERIPMMIRCNPEVTLRVIVPVHAGYASSPGALGSPLKGDRDLSELQRQLFENRRQAQEEIARLKESLKEMTMRHKQALRKDSQYPRHMNHSATMENQFQILRAQNYELHEYPIPRYFIILPREGRKRDIARNWVSKTFRLHFLCECGAHTGRETDGSPHKIHLANHEGYDIVKPSDFVKKYRSHLLNMLQMVKYSLAIAEFAVPALQHFKLVKGLGMIAPHLKSNSKTFSDLLDESISFIKDSSGKYDNIVGVPTQPIDLRKLPGISGPLLRQLESFLSLNDRGRVLGNLYRIPTKTGHIKWVCMDHYKRYSLSSTAVIRRLGQLHTFTTANGGAFIEAEGMVRVKLDSEARAEQFYDMIEGVECILELQIALEWTVTTHDLRDLCEVVTNSNIVRLELSGCGKADSTSGIDSSLFRPLLDLMLNGKIQIMVLQKIFHRDFLYVNGSGVGATSKLRELTFKDLSAVHDGMTPTLPGIIGLCLSLTTLSVKSEFAHDVLSQILRDPLRFKHLKTLVMHETGQRHYHLVVGLSRGRIRSIEVMRLSSGSWNADGIHELLSCGYITKLGVLLDGAETHGDRCMEILRYNPKVLEFHLFIPELSASAMDWVITSMREFHAKQQSIPQYLIKIHCDTHPEVVSCALDFNKDSQTFNISTHIQLIPEVCNMDNLIELAREFGWSVTRLDFRSYFDRKVASALASSVMYSHSSRLKWLLLDPAKLISKDDFACIDRILSQSKHLTTFSAVLRMDDNNWKAGATWLFGAYREILTGLILEGAKDVIWNRELANLFPSRSELKNLEALSLKKVDTAKDVKSFVKWVAGMISNPSPRSSWSKLLTRGESTMTTSNSSDRTHLKLIEIDSITLDENRWVTVFESMDCTDLEKLTLMDNKLTSKQLELLMNCIVNFADDNTVLPLQELNIGGYLDDGLWYLSDEDLISLMKKAPLVEAYTPGDSSAVSKARSIHTRLDNRGGQHFVLWKDIQSVFPHAKYILNSDEVVSFIKDEDSNEVQPLRIACQPGIVLRVVVPTHKDSAYVLPEDSSYISTSLSEGLAHTTPPPYESSGLSTRLHNVDKIEPSWVTEYEKSLDSMSKRLNLANPSTSKLFAERPAESYLFSMEPGASKVHVTPSRKLKTDGSDSDSEQLTDTDESIRIGELVDETNQNDIFQEVDQIKHLIHLEQLQASEIQEQLRKEFVELQLELEAMEEQRFDSERHALLSVADMRRRITTILDRTYEPQEDSMPRLFIVLPTGSTTSNTTDTDPSTKFRLYFLCECSTTAHSEDDTDSEDDINSEEDVLSQGIHLVKHEGYYIKKPDDFFQKFGPYVLTMLQMVRYGFVAVGVTVPALAHFQQIKGIEAIERILEITQAKIGSLVDDSIAFVEDYLANMADGINMPVDSLNTSNQEMLEKVDLQQLESYLSMNDSNGILGGLYWTVNPEGHVKWVCFHHLNELNVETAFGMRLKIHGEPTVNSIPRSPSMTSDISDVESYNSSEHVLNRSQEPMVSQSKTPRDLKTSNNDDDSSIHSWPLSDLEETSAPALSQFDDCIMERPRIDQFSPAPQSFRSAAENIFNVTSSTSVVHGTWMTLITIKYAGKANGVYKGPEKTLTIPLGSSHILYPAIFIKPTSRLVIVIGRYLQVWKLHEPNTTDPKGGHRRGEVAELELLWALQQDDKEKYQDTDICQRDIYDALVDMNRGEQFSIKLQPARWFRRLKPMSKDPVHELPKGPVHERIEVVTVPMSSKDTLPITLQERVIQGIRGVVDMYINGDKVCQEVMIRYLRTLVQLSDDNPVSCIVTLCHLWKYKEHVYIERIIADLLPTTHITWVPVVNPYEKDKDPLAILIKTAETQPSSIGVAKVIMDYCVSHANSSKNLALLTPIFKSMHDAMRLFPEEASEYISRIAYIPAKDRSYILDNHIIACPPRWRLQFWKPQEKVLLCNTLEPIMQLNVTPIRPDVLNDRFTLPVFMASFDALWLYHNDERDIELKDRMKTERLSRHMTTRNELKTAVATASTKKKEMSRWTTVWYMLRLKLQLRNKTFVEYHDFNLDFFDNPAIAALIAYKWNTIGFRYWLVRFIFQCLYYTLTIVAAFLQVYLSDPKVLFGVFVAIIVMAAVFIWLETLQAIQGWAKYKGSMYNFLDLLAFLVPMAASVDQILVILQNDHQGNTHLPSVSVLIVSLHMLFELRINQSICKFVTIIQQVLAEIKVFFVISAAGIVSFTIGISLRTCLVGGCPPVDDESAGTGNPPFLTKFFHALSSTYLFMGGRYDPISEKFNSNDWEFYFTMFFIYYFFLVILMLNVLIALTNVALTKGDDGWRLAWVESRLRYIESAENMSYHIPGYRASHDCFPEEIYFSSTLQQVEEYQKRFREKYEYNLDLSKQSSLGGAESTAATLVTEAKDRLTLDAGGMVGGWKTEKRNEKGEGDQGNKDGYGRKNENNKNDGNKSYTENYKEILKRRRMKSLREQYERELKELNELRRRRMKHQYDTLEKKE